MGGCPTANCRKAHEPESEHLKSSACLEDVVESCNEDPDHCEEHLFGKCTSEDCENNHDLVNALIANAKKRLKSQKNATRQVSAVQSQQLALQATPAIDLQLSIRDREQDQKNFEMQREMAEMKHQMEMALLKSQMQNQQALSSMTLESKDTSHSLELKFNDKLGEVKDQAHSKEITQMKELAEVKAEAAKNAGKMEAMEKIPQHPNWGWWALDTV